MADATTTPPAKPIHRIEVHNVCISVFPDDRCTLQRRFTGKDGKTGYAKSLRPADWKPAREALQALEDWYASRKASEAA